MGASVARQFDSTSAYNVMYIQDPSRKHHNQKSEFKVDKYRCEAGRYRGSNAGQERILYGGKKGSEKEREKKQPHASARPKYSRQKESTG